MNTFGTFLGVLKSSFYATSSTTLHVYSQNVHQRNVHEIDEEVKISARLLHSRVIYIFASSRSFRGDIFLIILGKRDSFMCTRLRR